MGLKDGLGLGASALRRSSFNMNSFFFKMYILKEKNIHVSPSGRKIEDGIVHKQIVL